MSVCQSQLVSATKTVEPIEMPFGGVDSSGPDESRSRWEPGFLQGNGAVLGTFLSPSESTGIGNIYITAFIGKNKHTNVKALVRALADMVA